MATTPEGRVKESIKRVLKKYNAYYHMPVQNGMGAPTLDFVACVNGYFVAIEAKQKGKKPTTRQADTMAKMTQAGGFVFVVSDEQELTVLEGYLRLISK